MAKDFLTDEQVEIEIQRLLNSEDVKLGKPKLSGSTSGGNTCTACGTWKNAGSSWQSAG